MGEILDVVVVRAPAASERRSPPLRCTGPGPDHDDIEDLAHSGTKVAPGSVEMSPETRGYLRARMGEILDVVVVGAGPASRGRIAALRPTARSS